MNTRDLFSGHASVYKAFRPTYPDALYQFIYQHLKNYNSAWDCATGNGQVSQYLSQHFQQVFATDISQQQLDNAYRAGNIFYSVSPAEHTAFAENTFDLITVGQALHWFDRDKFYQEVKRVGKPDSLLAVWGYALLYIEPDIDEIIMDFYTKIVGPYWDEARKLVEQQYKTISFPFEEIAAPDFSIDVEWGFAQLTGYLESWSATQKFIQANHFNPVTELMEKLKPHWQTNEIKPVRFPVFLRLGKIKK
jgi:SAM-dependent methyltransferase